MDYLFQDAETYSECDIRTAGAAKYARDPSTESLIWTWSLNGKPVQLWDRSQSDRVPAEFLEMQSDPSIIKVAFNAPFDRGIIQEVEKVNSPVEQWRCAMVAAYGLGFTGGLDAILDQTGQNVQKNTEGKKLIQRFSKPAPANHKADRYNWDTHPDEWQRFCDYAVQDVKVLIKLWNWVQQYEPMSDEEWQLWFLDQQINERGIPVDLSLAQTAMQMHKTEKQRLRHELREQTGLANPLAAAQMLPYLKSQGLELPNMRAETVAEVLSKPMNGQESLRPILSTYSTGVSTAPTKWKAFIEKSCDDARVRGMFQFAGASRTRRWASRGVQLQNLKRGPVDEFQPEAIATGDPDWVQLMYGDTITSLAQSVRSAISAPEGQSLVVCDLSSIESRVLGWISHCERINNVFAEGKDTYKDFAQDLFNVPYDDVTKAQRTIAKPPVLGAGYRLGGPGLQRYAKDMGVQLELSEAFNAVKLWRSGHPEVVDFWNWLESAIFDVLQSETNRRHNKYGLIIGKRKEFLYIKLPSGRRLLYHKPRIEARELKWIDENGERQSTTKDSFTYMGINRYNSKWERISAHMGGVTENIVQAIARDILGWQMLEMDKQNIELVGSVHDEVMVLANEHDAEQTYQIIQKIMATSPPWASDMILDAEGYTAKRYRKD